MYLTLYLTLYGLKGEPIILSGRWLTGLVHNKAHHRWSQFTMHPEGRILGASTISWSKLFQHPTTLCKRRRTSYCPSYMYVKLTAWVSSLRLQV